MGSEAGTRSAARSRGDTTDAVGANGFRRARALVLAAGAVWALAAVPAAFAAGTGRPVVCMPGSDPSGAGVTGIFSPESPPAESIREVAWLVLAICGGIFLVVEGAIVYAVIRFRRRRRDEAAQGAAGERGSREPTQLYGSGPIELAWTVVPLGIVFLLTLVTIRTIREVELTAPPEGALRVEVIGHQWWWEYRYPDAAGPGRPVVTANELHVPVDRPIWLEMSSADVAHSWWVPKLAGKMDLIPGRTNRTWFQARRAGLFLGQCAEYCGTQHANMLLRVYVTSAADFDAWLRHQASAPVVPAAGTPAAEGRELFMDLACMNCHDVDGMSTGMFGPNLTHLMSRETIAAGMTANSAASLRAWLDDPQRLKPGCNMPSLKLEPQELDQLTAYLETLH